MRDTLRKRKSLGVSKDKDEADAKSDFSAHTKYDDDGN